MSNIEGYSIQNGEPTPDNPAEIKSLDIEKDIKFIDEMIKEYNTFGDLDNTDYEDTDKIYKAIENILAERKQNKARIKELEAKQKEMCEEYCPKTERIKELEQENRIQRRQLNSAFDRGWIPKQKVKDLLAKIQKEYEKLDKASDEFLNNKEKTAEDYVLEKERLVTMQTLAYCRDNLEELLEDK